jgi:hypothetical protein
VLGHTDDCANLGAAGTEGSNPLPSTGESAANLTSPITVGRRKCRRVVPSCSRQVEPELTSKYGTETAVLDWRERLVCSQCGSRNIDMVVSGTKRR